MAPLAGYALVAAIVLVLIVIVLSVAKKTLGVGAGPKTKGRGPRLAVLDVSVVDPKRKLVLVRRDDVEHLLLIGGQNDLVVEGSISRTPAKARPARTDPMLGAEADYLPAATQRDVPPRAMAQAPAVRGASPLTRPVPRPVEPPASAPTQAAQAPEPAMSPMVEPMPSADAPSAATPPIAAASLDRVEPAREPARPVPPVVARSAERSMDEVPRVELPTPVGSSAVDVRPEAAPSARESASSRVAPAVEPPLSVVDRSPEPAPIVSIETKPSAPTAQPPVAAPAPVSAPVPSAPIVAPVTLPQTTAPMRVPLPVPPTPPPALPAAPPAVASPSVASPAASSPAASSPAAPLPPVRTPPIPASALPRPIPREPERAAPRPIPTVAPPEPKPAVTPAAPRFAVGGSLEPVQRGGQAAPLPPIQQRSMATPTYPAKPSSASAELEAKANRPEPEQTTAPERSVDAPRKVVDEPSPEEVLARLLAKAKQPVAPAASPATPAPVQAPSDVTVAERLEPAPVTPSPQTRSDAAPLVAPAVLPPIVAPVDLGERGPLSVRSFASAIQGRQGRGETVEAPQPTRRDPDIAVPEAPATEPMPAKPPVAAPAVALSSPATAWNDEDDDLEDFLSAQLNEQLGEDIWATKEATVASPAPAVRAAPPVVSSAPPVRSVDDAASAPVKRQLTLEEEMERLLGDFDLETSDRRVR